MPVAVPIRTQSRKYSLVVSNHAWERIIARSRIRTKRTKLQNYLETKLNDKIRSGLRIDRTGAAWLEINSHLWASVRLEGDVWVVTTVINYSEIHQLGVEA